MPPTIDKARGIAPNDIRKLPAQISDGTRDAKLG
jgi:hypothetical protein